MAYMIEITESEIDNLAENVEEMLRLGGKVMTCVDRMKGGRMGKRMPDYRDRRDRDEYDDGYDDRGYGRRSDRRY